MHASRWNTKSFAVLVAGIVVSLAPSLALADHDHHRREHRDERRSECRSERQHHHQDRYVRWVEVRRPAPRFTVGFQVGGMPYCAPVRVYCPPPAPVYYTPDACGAYYDPYCGSRFSNFELYLEHVSRNHSVAVSVRN